MAVLMTAQLPGATQEMIDGMRPVSAADGSDASSERARYMAGASRRRLRGRPN